MTEIFCSLQGESRSVGWPTVFVRLTGCPLRCTYCDTTYSFTGGEWLSLEEVVDQVRGHPVKHVCVTGGEPLAQRNCLELLRLLCDLGYEVSLETSGAMDVSQVDVRVIKVMDLKTPASGEEGKNKWENLDRLLSHDQVKFVICDRNDYDWSVAQLMKHELESRCEVLFSPVHGSLKPRMLAEWMLEDGLQVRFQLQLHKFVWGNEPGH